MSWKWLFILLIAYGALQHWQDHRAASVRTPGITVAGEPLQADPGPAPDLGMKGYRIQPLARFSIQARVLGAERYRFGREADLSPLDLALGWGPMSDSAVLSRISISQGNRFYHWRVENEFPIPREAIETHSANMHLIPATEAVADRMLGPRPGQIVRIQGFLVEASAADGWRWRSSLTRKDTGGGACELIWVEAFEAL